MDNEVMTLSETAKYLKLAERTVLRMVHRNGIPCAKVASQWRFLRTVVDDWLITRMKVVPQNDLAGLIASGLDIVPLSRLIREELILTDLQPGPKDRVLHQLVQPLLEQKIIENGEAFVEKLLQRERLVSTGIGKGVAVPHLRKPQDNPRGEPVLVVGLCREGTDFDALDGRKTYLFLLLCTDSEVVHLRVLAKLNTILGNPEALGRLTRAREKDEIVRIFIKAEQALALKV